MSDVENEDKGIKGYYKIMTIVVSFVFILIIILNILKKDDKFSETENKMLSQKPKFSIDRLIEGRYTRNYEKYKVDQFIERDKWIKLKSDLDLIMGKNKLNGIYINKNQLIQEFMSPQQDVIDKNIKSINEFYNKHKKINQFMIIVPNAVSIMSDKLPQYAPQINQKTYLQNLKQEINPNIKFIDVYDKLKERKNEYIYYNTDHHWTTLGAYYTYLESCEVMNLQKKDYETQRVSNDFYGTLCSKSGVQINPDFIDIFVPKSEENYIINYVEEQKKSTSLYSSEKLKDKDKYAMFLDGNHSIIKINTDSKKDRSLLILKDSYANSFVPFLMKDFSNIVIVDPRYYYDDIEKLIKHEDISDILYLYNANTFFEDTSLKLVLNNE